MKKKAQQFLSVVYVVMHKNNPMHEWRSQWQAG